ncbi:MAG: transposase, partial [Rubrobacteraceae bacterium]|nr:transposase [Rubrobacteraceae bacterium]
REAGKVPHSSIDTEAGWTKSGWHGWVYGWKLHLATTVAGVWIPLAARLTPANVADNRIAPLLIKELPEEARFVLRIPTTMRPRCARPASRARGSW